MPPELHADLPPDARLTLQTLGVARLVARNSAASDKPLLDGGKPHALLAYLAATPGRQARRDQLIDLLWADLEPDAAKHALRQTLWYLKKRVGEGVVVAQGEVLTVSPQVEVDRDDLLKAASTNDHERVVATFTGDFLPDFAAPGGAGFESWADVERRRLRSIFIRSTEASVRELLARGRVRDAITRAQRAREIDKLNQASWRLLLETLVAGNDWSQAQFEADSFERLMLTEETELEPSSRAQIRVARQGAGEVLQPDPESRSLTAELVGREREFALLLEAAAHAHRGRGAHLHLRAAPGLGKSRLLGDLYARLRSTRTRVVMVRCDVGGRELPYAAASELALALGRLSGARGISPDSASALVAMAPALSTFFTVPNDRSSGMEALRRRTQALEELAAAVADEQALVILLDDVHWMDASSRTVIAHLAARVGDAPILLVSAGRPVVEGRLDAPDARVIELPVLTESQCAELVASIATLGNANWVGRFVPELWRTTSGSPLHVIETLQLLRERELLVVLEGEWQAPAPEALFALLREGGALVRRLEALPRESRFLLLLLSVGGAVLPDQLLADAAGGNKELHHDALGALERRGLIAKSEAGWIMSHDEMANAVLERSSDESTRAAHAALGSQFWLASPTDLPSMRVAAQHLVQGGDEAPRNAIFQQFVRRMRGLGDARALSLLADDLLGRHASPLVVREMVDALPWHVRIGLTSTRRLAAVAAVAAILWLSVAVAALARVLMPTAPTPVAELLVFGAYAEGAHARLVPIFAGDWIPGLAINIPPSTAGIDVGPVAGRPVLQDPRHPGQWLSSRSVRDSGVIDLFSFGPAGLRRITYSPGDDMLGDVSPDGRFVVISTARWNAQSHYDLAVVDLTTGEYRALTRGDESDQFPRWNHAGDRIAFWRRTWTDETTKICLVNPDGSDLSCPQEWSGFLGVVGWVDDDHLMMVRPAGERSELIVAGISDHRLQSLDERVIDTPTISPDGRWLACQCERIGFEIGTWFVMPVGRRAEARPLVFERGGQASYVSFTSMGRPPSLQRMSIDVGPGTPVVGVAHRLRAHAGEGAHRAGELTRVRWRSRSPDVLSIDSLTGLAIPRRAGEATVEVSAPGWLRATRTITVMWDSVTALDTESWDSNWSSRWYSFGEPTPTIESHDGIAYLRNNGDSSYSSGAIRRSGIPVARGVAIEARVSIRILRPQWQVVALVLTHEIDLSSISDDSKAIGVTPALQGRNSECGGMIPSGEGLRSYTMARLWMGPEQARITLPEGVKEGRWVTLRVQLFPDGRCGVAMDGRPIFLSQQPMDAGGRVQVETYGSSHQTVSLVGPIRIWQGIPRDIDWEGIDRSVAARPDSR